MNTSLDQQTREALLREYERAREQRLKHARYGARPGCCKYCGRRRALHAWNQDKCTLDGHAICVVTPEFMQLVRSIGARPVTYATHRSARRVAANHPRVDA